MHLFFEDNFCVTFRQYSFKREGESVLADDFELSKDDDDYIKSDSSKLFDEGFIQAPSKCNLVRSMTFGGRINKQDSPFYTSPSGAAAIIGNSKYHTKANLITEKMRQEIIESYSTARPIIGIEEFHVTVTFHCNSTLYGYGKILSDTINSSNNAPVAGQAGSNKGRVMWIEAFARAKALERQSSKA
jgi:hypothetical protein